MINAPTRSTNQVVWTLRGARAQCWLLRGLHRKQGDFLCHLGDNLQTAITVAKSSEMIPRGSQVILVEANEPEECAPASVTWQLVENQENGPGRNVSKCLKAPLWPAVMEYSPDPGQPALSHRSHDCNNPSHLPGVLQFAKHAAFPPVCLSHGCT